MPQGEPDPKKEPIEYLVRSRFPRLYDDLLEQFPFLKRGVLSEGFEREKAEAEAYRAELGKLSPSELELKVQEHKNALVQAIENRRQREEEQRFFNLPRCRADNAYWAKMSYWSEDELTALLLERDPRHVTWANTSPLASASAFAARYSDTRAIILRAVESRQIFPQTPPSIAIAWAQRMQIPVPSALVEEIGKLGIQIADWKTLYDDLRLAADQQKSQHQGTVARLNERLSALQVERDGLANRLNTLEGQKSLAKPELGTRQRETMLRLIIGMAIKGYSYNSKANRSPIPAEICADLSQLGISISDDTIRSYLNEAKELLPPSKAD